MELSLLLTFFSPHFASILVELSLVLEDNIPLISLVSGLLKITIERIQVVGLGLRHELLEALESGVVLILLLKRHAPLEMETFLLPIDV